MAYVTTQCIDSSSNHTLCYDGIYYTSIQFSMHIISDALKQTVPRLCYRRPAQIFILFFAVLYTRRHQERGREGKREAKEKKTSVWYFCWIIQPYTTAIWLSGHIHFPIVFVQKASFPLRSYEYVLLEWKIDMVSCSDMFSQFLTQAKISKKNPESGRNQHTRWNWINCIENDIGWSHCW